MTQKLWPWPILIILHDICVAIKNSFFSGAFKTRQVNTVPRLPGPTPNAALNPSPQLVNPIPTRIQISQPFDPAPEEPIVNSMPSPPTPRFIDIPNSPTSPSFVTPPSSPVQVPDIPEASCPPPEPVTLPINEPETHPQVRRSTRIRNPPKRYNPAEYDLT